MLERRMCISQIKQGKIILCRGKACASLTPGPRNRTQCPCPGSKVCRPRAHAQLEHVPTSSHSRHACVLSCSAVSDSTTPRTVSCQAPLSMGFSRQECWSGLPCPPPGDLPDPGIMVLQKPQPQKFWPQWFQAPLQSLRGFFHPPKREPSCSWASCWGMAMCRGVNGAWVCRLKCP